jgi:hypothetical protein
MSHGTEILALWLVRREGAFLPLRGKRISTNAVSPTRARCDSPRLRYRGLLASSAEPSFPSMNDGRLSDPQFELVSVEGSFSFFIFSVDSPLKHPLPASLSSSSILLSHALRSIATVEALSGSVLGFVSSPP